LGHFSASHWMDSTLTSEFYLKGFDWLNKPEADKAYTDNRNLV